MARNKQDDDNKGVEINKNDKSDPNWQPAQTGAVLDPEHDGRLKKNRDQGVTKGTTPHAAAAPGAEEDRSGYSPANEETERKPGVNEIYGDDNKGNR